MTSLANHQDVCRQFAALCCYPDADLPKRADACHEQLHKVRPEAASALQPFVDFVTDSPETQLEELYTGTFDLQASCHPYVGYLLCGESQQRTLFLMKLQEIYRDQDYQAQDELPDHLSEVLHFVGICNDQRCRRELIDDGLLPALEKLIPAIECDDHPYKALLVALQSFLSEGQSKGADPC